MSCWRVLSLSESAESQHVPQLLIKPDFRQKAYTVFLTDLSNIWSEELGLDEIVARAAQQESPIEVSTQDTGQLAILLEHVKQSLSSDEDSVCRITKGDADGVILYTTNSLPEPLGPLKWRFNFTKRDPAVLKNELILPLLVSSHIQHERVNGLVSSIHEKDRVIARLLDQFETSNLDLASAFPSLAGSKPGRRLVKREQAERHIPALKPFPEDEWKRETGQLKDGGVSTLGLFQEALSECNPKVPAQMKKEDADSSWWTAIPSSTKSVKIGRKQKPKKMTPPPRPIPETGDDETETEDEFETHENFKQREAHETPSKARESTPPPVRRTQQSVSDDETGTDEDLDAPPKSQSQNQSQGRSQTRSSTKTLAPQSPEPESPPQATASPVPKKSMGFRIGGARAKKVAAPEQDEEMPDAPVSKRSDSDGDATPQKPRKMFKIGGKDKHPQESKGAVRPVSPSPNMDHDQERGATATEQAQPSAEEAEHEETPEEKAERRRRELKRKNEEIAKKQAQKKKKRF